MTLGSDVGSDGADSEQNKSADCTGAPTEGDKPTRKVSKTIVEGTTPQSPEPPAKLAKTILELSRPDLAELASASDVEHHEHSTGAAQLAPRKVGKTMLELSLPADFLVAKQGKKVAKTILDFDSRDASDGVKDQKSQAAVRVLKSLTEVTPPSSVSQVSDLDGTAVGAEPDKTTKSAESSELDTTVKVPAPIHGTERYVAKTMLDHKVLSSALEKSAEKKKARAAELALERANEPVKEVHQVDSKKMATSCSFTWSESSGERVRACSKCHTQVYDLTGMELSEAESLIFKQESVKKATLFKRADGKFMTKDCPLQARRKRNLLLLCVVGALAILSALAVLIMMPPQPTPTATIVVKSKRSTDSESKENIPLQGEGTFHYRAGEPEDVQPDSNSPTVSGTPSPTSSTTPTTSATTPRASSTAPTSATTTTTTTSTSDTEMEWDTSGAN